MKISQLLSGIPVVLSNQEQQFVEKYHRVKIDSLTEQDKWLAQNLVRKGVYDIDKDNQTLFRRINEN